MSALGRGWRRPLTAAFGSDERSGLAGCHRWWAAFLCGLGIVTELLTGLAELVTVLIPAVGNLFHTNDVQIQGKRIQSVEPNVLMCPMSVSLSTWNAFACYMFGFFDC